MTTRAVVNVATGRYVAGQERLQESIEQWAPDAWLLFWRDQWPPFSPPHQEIPYAFKPLAVLAARAIHQADVALWIDASCVVTKQLDPIWAYIEEHGMLLFEDGWYLGQWATDRSLETLGYSRDEAMQVPLIYATVMGFDFRKERTNTFLDEWVHYALDGETFPGPWSNTNCEASRDQRCLGHRHDQTAASALAQRMSIPLFRGFEPFFSLEDSVL